MINIQGFTFNPFQENTYVVWDHTNASIIIDPGCQTNEEKMALFDFIAARELDPIKIVNTHCHIDHVLGIDAVAKQYNIPFYMPEGEMPVLLSAEASATMFGLFFDAVKTKPNFIAPDKPVEFGESSLQVLKTPGHSPDSYSFYSKSDKLLIAGDVLFNNSIGRTDLPGGDYDTLMESIDKQFMSLPDEVTVYSGHGPTTTIGDERRCNPFIREYRNT